MSVSWVDETVLPYTMSQYWLSLNCHIYKTEFATV